MKTLITAVGLGLLVPSLQATNRYFSDLEATSSTGRFRVEAKSPDNLEGPWKRPFQEQFLYRMLEKGKTNAVWSRQQRAEPHEGPPVAIYVSDDGWTVIRTADLLHLSTDCELVVVDPTGKDKLHVDILKTLLRDKNGSLRYTVISSAGLLWGAEYCHPYFVILRRQTHFCLATWWGERLVLDLSAGGIVNVSSEFETELLKVERAFVLATLEATSLWKFKLDEKANPGLAKGSPGPVVQDVIAAMLMAANVNILEAVPYLRKLEASPISLSTLVGRSPYEPPIGGIKPNVYQNLTLRQTAQLCLRRLGLRPSSHQSTRLFRGDIATYWQPDDPLPFQREKRVQELKPGMKPEEVVALIGTPDLITPHGWEYDLDGDTPATLVIRWGQGGLEEPEKSVPPKWHSRVERDWELVR